MLTHRNLLMMILSYYADIDQLDTRDTVIHAATHVACLGAIRPAAHRPWRQPCSSRKRPLRTRRTVRTNWATRKCQHVCGADHVDAAGQQPGGCGRRFQQPQINRLRRRSDVCRRSRPCARRGRSAIGGRSTARAKAHARSPVCRNRCTPIGNTHVISNAWARPASRAPTSRSNWSTRRTMFSRWARSAKSRCAAMS